MRVERLKEELNRPVITASYFEPKRQYQQPEDDPRPHKSKHFETYNAKDWIVNDMPVNDLYSSPKPTVATNQSVTQKMWIPPAAIDDSNSIVNQNPSNKKDSSKGATNVDDSMLNEMHLLSSSQMPRLIEDDR